MLLTDPERVDVDALGAEIARGGSAPRIQFSGRRQCAPEVLAQLNGCCARFGAGLVVRFFGFYNDSFDAAILAHIPEVRSLIIDVHAATDIEIIGQLEHLEELGLGVFEGNYPNILASPRLKRLRKLILIDNRRNNVDLSPLIEFTDLTELLLCAHARNIEILGKRHGIRKLALNKMRTATQFHWIHDMQGLRDLTILLGARASIDEVQHSHLERLRIDRIRGLETIALESFPGLSHLHIEDQARVTMLNVAPLASTLQRMTVWNCKELARIEGLGSMKKLEFLWLGKTSLDAEEILKEFPTGLRELTLAGYGKLRDAKLKERVHKAGLAPAGYVG